MIWNIHAFNGRFNTSRTYFFSINNATTTVIYTLSLHDALPISRAPSLAGRSHRDGHQHRPIPARRGQVPPHPRHRSEEHTSELQSHSDLVCRLLLEKKKLKRPKNRTSTGSSRTIRTQSDTMGHQ